MVPVATGVVTATEPSHLGTSKVRIRNILVAMDGFEDSPHVLELGVSAAHCFGARLVALHVVAPMIYTPGAEAGWNTLLETAISEARSRLEQAVAPVPGWHNLQHLKLVEMGPFLDVMQRTVEQQEIDLVVCGSRGARGLERAIHGSTAELILRYLPCPVLIAGPNCCSYAFQSASILFSTSLGLGSYRPAQYAAALAEEWNARLTVLHLAPAVASEIPEELVRHRLCNEARALLPADLENWCRLKTCVLFGESAECIARVACSESAGLIVMGVREGGKSTSALADHLPPGALATTIRAAHCPVLAVRGHFSDE